MAVGGAADSVGTEPLLVGRGAIWTAEDVFVADGNLTGGGALAERSLGSLAATTEVFTLAETRYILIKCARSVEGSNYISKR